MHEDPWLCSSCAALPSSPVGGRHCPKMDRLLGDAQRPAPRTLRLQLFFWMALASRCSAEMYCGKDDCYQVLGVAENADSAAIKKAYRRLSMQWHPDKNPNRQEEATIMFQKIATAYEVMSDTAKRENYDYARRHPEEAMYNQYRYYKTMVGQKVPLEYVIFGIIAFFSLLQYVNKSSLVKSYRKSLPKTPWFKREVQLATERRKADLGGKAKLSAAEEHALVEELLAKTEIDGMRLSSFRLTDLLVVKVLLSPFWLVAYMWRAPERRALRKQMEGEENFKQEQMEAESRRSHEREAETLRKRQAGNHRKQQDSLEIAQARERAQAERKRELEDQAREVDERWKAVCQAREKVKKIGQQQGFAADDLQQASGLSGELQLELARELEALDAPKARHACFQAAVACARASTDHERELREAATRTPWRAEEVVALAKAMLRFPGGVPNRWGKICAFLEQTVGGQRRSDAEAADKARSLAVAPPPNSEAAAAEVGVTVEPVPQLSRGNGPEPKASAEPKAFVQPKASAEDAWTAAQQAALEDALVLYPASLGFATNERWDRIAACVKGMSRKQCVERFKSIREKMQSASKSV